MKILQPKTQNVRLTFNVRASLAQDLHELQRLADSRGLVLDLDARLQDALQKMLKKAWHELG